MPVILGFVFSALALVILVSPRLAVTFERRRLAAPDIVLLCMSFETARQARLELRIKRPAATPDWRVSRIEWLAPAGVGIALALNDPQPGRAVEADLHPKDQRGYWFSSDATLWAHYPGQSIGAHRVRLRLTVECASGLRRRMVVSSIFPPMDWTAPASARTPILRRLTAQAVEPALRIGDFATSLRAPEARNAAPRRWSVQGLVGQA